MKITGEMFGLLALLVGAAVIAMFIARPQIITDVFGGFSQALNVAISPVTNGGSATSAGLRGRFQ